MRSLASRENFTSFAAMVPYLYFLIGNCVIGWNQPLLPSPRASADDAEDVALFHDEQVLAIDLHFGARPLAEQNAVARLHVQRGHLAIFAARARAYGDDFAFLRLFLRRIGIADAACGLPFGFDPADETTVMQRPKSHTSTFLNPPNATYPSESGKASS